MERFLRFALTIFILVLMGILSGAYYQQFFKREMPCPLCLLQRLAMFGVSLGDFMNLRFGLRARYFAFSLFSALLGAGISIRQILLHICPGSPIFGIPVYGLNLYTWAFLAFAGSILAISLALILLPRECKIIKMNKWEWFTVCVVLALLLSNTITTYIECGIGACPDLPWSEDLGSPL